MGVNEKLAPHGIKCQDMTLVVERAVEQSRLELVERIYAYAMKNTSRAVIIFNTPATRSYLLLLVRRGDGPWQFIHSDNFYVPPNIISLDKQIDSSIQIVTGGEECCICLESIECDEARGCYQLHCGHAFHRSCMDTSLKAGNTDCPLCRAPVMFEETTALL